MNPQRMEGLENISLSEISDELASFVYRLGWMSVAIPDFSRRVAPLVDILEQSYTLRNLEKGQLNISNASR